MAHLVPVGWEGEAVATPVLRNATLVDASVGDFQRLRNPDLRDLPSFPFTSSGSPLSLIPGHIARMCPAAGGFRGGFGGRGGFAARPRATSNPDGTPVKC